MDLYPGIPLYVGTLCDVAYVEGSRRAEHCGRGEIIEEEFGEGEEVGK